MLQIINPKVLMLQIINPKVRMLQHRQMTLEDVFQEYAQLYLAMEEIQVRFQNETPSSLSKSNPKVLGSFSSL
jgi:hypothetical protein